MAESDRNLFIVSECEFLPLSEEIVPVFLGIVSITSDDACEALASSAPGLVLGPPESNHRR